MDVPAQYIYSSAFPPMIYPPTMRVEGSICAKNVDVLTARMENAYITAPAHSGNTWAEHGSASASPDLPYIYASSGTRAFVPDTEFYQVSVGQHGSGSSSEYDVFAPWQVRMDKWCSRAWFSRNHVDAMMMTLDLQAAVAEREQRIEVLYALPILLTIGVHAGDICL